MPNIQGIRSIQIPIIQEGNALHIRKAIENTYAISFIESQDALLIQALNAFIVSSINRGSKRLIVPNLATCLDQISSGLRLRH